MPIYMCIIKLKDCYYSGRPVVSDFLESALTNIVVFTQLFLHG